MQALKNGIKTTLRTPWRALQFAAVLLLLSLLLSVAFCVFAAVRSYIKDCGTYFHTIVDLEYVGRDYPSGMVYDASLVEAVNGHEDELNALAASKEVMNFEPVSNAAAMVKGLHRKDRLVYDVDAAVMILCVTGYNDYISCYSAVIEKTLYSRSDETGKMILLCTKDMNDPEAEKLANGVYIVCGHFFCGLSNYLWFEAEDIELPGSGIVPAATLWNGGDIPESGLYEELAEYLRSRNDCCPVRYTAALEDLLPYHQQQISVSSGRIFDEAEYAENAKVCIISERLAGAVECECGDVLELAIRKTSGDLYGESAVNASEKYEKYTVIGVYDRNDEYPYDIFLPASEVDREIAPVNGYHLGRFRIENEAAAEFMAKAAPLAESGFRFTLYDQGYSAAVEPMQDMLLISALFLLVCVVMAAAALCVECHLLITRQQETAQTMLALGSGKPHVLAYFISAVLMLAVPAAIAGCILGKRMELKVFDVISRFTNAHKEQDLRFSSSRLSLVRTLEFAPKIPVRLYVLAGVCLLAAAVLLTLLFSHLSLHDKAKRPKRKLFTSEPKARRSSHLKCGLKYALLSIRRSRGKTIAVLLLAAITAIFFGFLTNSLESYREGLREVKKNTVITGHATDYHGQMIDNVVVSSRTVNAFIDEGLTKDNNLTNNICHIRFEGVSCTAEGEDIELEDAYIPNNMETLFDQMTYERMWVQTGSISSSPLFYYSKPTSLRWLEGRGEEDLKGEEWCCVLPESMMDRYGINLGDTCRFLYAFTDGSTQVADLIYMPVIGAYSSSTDCDTVFSPIGCKNIMTDKAERGFIALMGRFNNTFDSFVFTLNDTESLPEVREALAEAGFNHVGSGSRAGTYVVIDDDIYLNTTRSMERQIKYVGTLYICLYAAAGIIGFTLSWLFTAARRKEMATMLAIGAKPIRIAANFWFEQTALCLAGLAAGLAIFRLCGGTLNKTQLILTAGFLAIWSLTALIGAAAGIKQGAGAASVDAE